LDLADEERPEAFLLFAERFGVLGLWPYETVDRHRVFSLDYWVPSVSEGVMTPSRYTVFHGPEEYELDRRGLLGMKYEPVAEWRRWAAWFRAVVLIAYELHNDRLGKRPDWAALDWDLAFDQSRFKSLEHFNSDIALQRFWLARLVQVRFIRWSGLVPVVRWDGALLSLTVALGGQDAIQVHQRGARHDWPDSSLFPALVAQLLATITAGEHIAACSFPGCGRLHRRARKPRLDQPVYCDDCRLIAERERKRRWASRARSTFKAECVLGA
jgi:hypothetical protein